MEKQVQEISVEDIEIKIRESKIFRLRYFAKKHDDYIVRYGMVCDKMKFWESKNGDICFTYFDIDAGMDIELQKISIGYKGRKSLVRSYTNENVL